MERQRDSAEQHSHHGHSHGHGHHHGHSHAPANYGRAFTIGVVLNSAFVIVEAGFGIASGSMALVADAGHNLSDVLSLLIAWGASIASQRPPSARFTYGYKSSSILAAMGNAALLLLALGAILYETIQRFISSWLASAYLSTQAPPCCSWGGAKMTSIFAVPFCIWRPMPWYR